MTEELKCKKCGEFLIANANHTRVGLAGIDEDGEVYFEQADEQNAIVEIVNWECIDCGQKVDKSKQAELTKKFRSIEGNQKWLNLPNN